MSKRIFVAVVALAVVVADQATKIWIRAALQPGDAIPVIDGFFHIVHARNPGGAFSFLAGAHESWRLPFFFLAGAIAIAALLRFLRDIGEEQRFLQFAVAGILGGAIGNLIDRGLFGHVTDFLDAHWYDAHFPAFNVADSFITIGVGVLLVASFFEQDGSENTNG